MKKIKFLSPVTVEIPSDDDVIERTFIKGEIINAKVMRHTQHKLDINFCGDEIYGIDATCVEVS